MVRMITWSEALGNENADLKLFLEQLLDGIDVDIHSVTRLRSGFKRKLARVTPYTLDRSVNFVFCGPDGNKKRAIAETLASRLGTEFIYVNCEEYYARGQNCEHAEPEKIFVEGKPVGEMGKRVSPLEIAFRKPSFGMIGWMIDAPPGFIAQDVGESLAERLMRNPYCLVFMDGIEKAGSSFLSFLSGVLKDGLIRGTKINWDGVPIKNSIIILSTGLSFKDRLSGHDLYDIWRKKVGTSDGFISECEIIGVKCHT